MFVYEVCQIFEEYRIPYAVVGGYAVALHGAVRGTVDLDIVINWSLKNLQKVEKTLTEIGLKSQLPINAETLFHFKDEYIKNRNLIAWNFNDPTNPTKQIDIIITYDLKNAHTKTIKTSFGNIKILSIKDLIKMKKESARPQDLADVKALESLQ